MSSSLPEALALALAQMSGTCPIARALASWPAEDSSWLSQQLTDPTLPSDALSGAVAELSPRLSSRDIARHRSGDCACIIPDPESGG